MDVGCYCVSGSRLLGGEPEASFGARVRRPDRNRLGLRRRRCATPATCSRSSTAAPRSPTATSSRRSAARARSSSTTRGIAASPVIELRREDGVERIEIEPADSYRLELENLGDAIRGEAEPLLGRADAVAQARALDALLRSAETVQPVEP